MVQDPQAACITPSWLSVSLSISLSRVRIRFGYDDNETESRSTKIKCPVLHKRPTHFVDIFLVLETTNVLLLKNHLMIFSNESSAALDPLSLTR